jgi:hypothetical protein
MDLCKDLIKAFNLIHNQFNQSTTNLRTIFQLLNETNLEIARIYSSVVTSMNVLQQKVQAIRVLSVLSSRQSQLWNLFISQYSELTTQYDQLITSIYDLQHGKINPYFITPKAMKEAIAKCQQSLQTWQPNYKFLYTNLAEFYTYSDAIFIPMKNGFLIQLQWPILPKKSIKYDLFHVQAIYMPVTTSPKFPQENLNHDFTKLVLPFPFLAVSEGKHFLQFDNPTLEKCIKISYNYYCYELFLESDHLHLTCLTALFLNHTAETINKFCDVEYFFEPYRPPPMVLDIGHSVVVSGLAQPWRYSCKDAKMPHDLAGTPYGVIPSNSLCDCSISSVNGHLTKRVTSCPDNQQPVLTINYVINSLVAENFPNLTEIDTDIDLQLNQDPPMKMLKLNLLSKLKNVQLHNLTVGNIHLKQLAQMIETKGQSFQDRWDSLEEDLSIFAWFSSNQWPKSLVLISSVMGALSFIMSIYLCCASRFTGGMVKSMMFLSAPQMARATNLNPCTQTPFIVDLSSSALIQITASHVAVIILLMMILYCGKKLIRFCCREANVFIEHPSLRQHDKVDIFLEFHSGHDRALLYLMTVRANVSRLHFDGELGPSQFTIDKNILYDILRPDWSSSVIHIDDVELQMPVLVPIPLYKRARIQNILNKACIIELIATEGAYLYKLKPRHNQPISRDNPYSPLIRELRKREQDYLQPSLSNISENNPGPNVGTGNDPVVRVPASSAPPITNL